MRQKEKAILRAKELILRIGDPSHGISHMESVLKYAKEISQSLPKVDMDMLEVAVWWHDVGRLHLDEGHAAKSTEMAAAELKELGFDDQTIAKIHDAIIGHSSRGEILPESIEAKILRDADKLDYLTPARWQVTIDNKKGEILEVSIRRIPIFRNHILSFDKSKEIFDRIFDDLIVFAKDCKDPYFQQYKERVLQMKIEV